jgi:type VI secretion system protein ImpI
MALTLEIVSEHREILGDDAVCVFDDAGGTIGRAFENDWVLPDPDKYVSGRHATIDCKGGAYYLADTSSNGTYVNDEYDAVGQDKPRRLFSGDRLRMGDFEFNVRIDEGENLELPPEAGPSVVPDHIEQLVPEVTLRTGLTLLDEDEITGDDEFQSALFGKEHGAGDDAVEPTSAPGPATEPEPAAAAAAPAAAEAPPPAAEASASAEDLFTAFLDGLGLARSDFRDDVDLAEVMQNAGAVVREFVAGTDQLIASRANLKDAFRLEQTTALPHNNNPLKLSENTSDSIRQLLIGREGEYLGPRDAVREVCRDLLFHQDAFLEAMSAAFSEFAQRFDPDELIEAFDRMLSRKPLIGALNHLKYWQLYTELYPVLVDHAGARFPQLIVEEFVRAYEREIENARHGISPRTQEAIVATRQSEPEWNTNVEAAFSAVFEVDVDEASN